MSGMGDMLVDHQRQNASSCLCGWAELGKSHPEHQAAMLSAAGFGPVKEAGAKALEDAAQELASLPYVKPGTPGRSEYEMVLAVRRGMADAWLKARAAAVRGER